VERTTALVHPTEEMLEEYAFERFPEERAAALEEHLLTCPTCQTALAEIDAFVALMKSATASYSEPQRAGLNRAGLISVAMLATASVVCLIAFRSSRTELPQAVPVTLTALRGNESPSAARAPAGRTLDLEVDMPGFALDKAYRLEIVNAAGRRAWTGSAAATNGRILAHLPGGLRAGVYWVRMYSGAELLREFGLRVE
jgi:hypothetical protein